MFQTTPFVVFGDSEHVVQYPHVCAGENGLLAVYRSEGAAGTRELRAQRLAGSGEPVGASFLLQAIDTATGHFPNARCSGVPRQNEFVVTFSNYVAGGSRANVFVQRYGADAELQEERVISEHTHWSSYSHVAPLGDGNVVVYGGSPTYPPRHIRYVRLDANSEPIGGPKDVTGPPTQQGTLA